MTTIKLVKGRSYAGNIKATREKPFVTCDDAIAEVEVASGFFVVASENEIPEADTPDENETPEENALPFESENEIPEAEGKPLDEMNKSELETFATYKNVDIKKAKTKADIIDILREALPAEELDGNIVYGSPTMTELQKEK